MVQIIFIYSKSFMFVFFHLSCTEREWERNERENLKKIVLETGWKKLANKVKKSEYWWEIEKEKERKRTLNITNNPREATIL